MLAPLNGCFLRLPDFIKIRVFAFYFQDLGFQCSEPFSRGIVRIFPDRFPFYLELDESPVKTIHRLRLGIDLHANPACRFVDEVDRLIRQLAVTDITMRQRRSRNNRGVCNIDAVMHLVLFLEATQNRDGVFHPGLTHQHLLETALKGGVLFYIFPVLIQGGGSDAVQFSAGQCRL